MPDGTMPQTLRVAPPRTRLMLNGRVLRGLLRLAAPNLGLPGTPSRPYRVARSNGAGGSGGSSAAA